MSLKLGFIKSKTIFWLKCKQLRLFYPKEKMWNYRDPNDNNHETLKSYFSFPSSPATTTSNNQLFTISSHVRCQVKRYRRTEKPLNESPATALHQKAFACAAGGATGCALQLLGALLAARAAGRATRDAGRAHAAAARSCWHGRTLLKFPTFVPLICRRVINLQRFTNFLGQFWLTKFL